MKRGRVFLCLLVFSSILCLLCSAIVLGSSKQSDFAVNFEGNLGTEPVKEQLSNQSKLEKHDAEEYAAWKQGLNSPSMRVRALSSSGNLLVSNEYVEFAVENTNSNNKGRFTMGTVAGNPDMDSDDRQRLLYGHPEPWSSYTTIRVDDADYIFKANNITADTEESSKVCWADMNIGDKVAVKQELKIVSNVNTGLQDTVEIKYILENKDTEIHNLGLRIMLDTKLGSNDGAPFRVPSYGNVTKELELTGNAIPAFWQAFDSLENPSVFSTGTFYQNISECPDKVQFAYWGDINDTTWNYRINEEKSLTWDSAVALYWNPVSVKPGERREYVTYYGMGMFLQQDLRPPLTVSVSAPKELTASADRSCYLPNPFNISAYISNISEVTAANAKVKLVLPEEIILVTDNTAENTSENNSENTFAKAEVMLGDMVNGQEKMITWQVQALDCFQEKEVTYHVVVTADNAESKTLSFNLSLPALLIPTCTRQAGNEYEQTTHLAQNVLAPEIKSIKVNLLDASIGHYRLTIDEFTVDTGARPFFYWKAAEGVFVNPINNFKQVEFIVDSGTQGRNIPVYVYLGDGLGRIDKYKVWVKGR
jgi:hypothetical protein